ncbi:MAG: sugar phosphate isomerase/epimerase [Clostridia bacterium]|nr:sugar phosphate isomerase/epimerase [Clostridia bacterium]
MRLSTQTGHSVARFGFEQAVTYLKEAGYDCLDFSLLEMWRDDSVYCGPDWKSVAQERRRFADGLGVTFNQSHAPFVFRWEDPTVRETVAHPRVRRSLEIAAIMGVPVVVVHPLHWMVYPGHEDEIHRQNVEYFRSLVPLARDLGIAVAAENMYQRDPATGRMIDDECADPAEFAALIDEVDSPYVTACLDLGHCAVVNREAQDAIRVLGHDRLRALHVHDNRYGHDDHMIPGLGKRKWPAIMQALAEIDYTGDFTYEADLSLHNFEDEIMPDVYRFMVRRGRQLIAMT